MNVFKLIATTLLFLQMSLLSSLYGRMPVIGNISEEGTRVVAFDAGISAINAPTGAVTTASVTPSVTLKNFGTTTLTSVTIFYKMDSGTELSKAWTGSLAPNATVSVLLNVLTGYSIGGHTFVARTSMPNGAADAYTPNDTARTSFSYMIPLTNDAGISAIAAPSGTVATASVTPSVTLKNFGTATLTSATIFSKIDNGTEVSKAWTGSLAPNASISVPLNSVSYSVGSHTFTARTSVPNGVTDATSANDTTKVNFTYTAPLTNDAGISAIAIPNGTVTTASVTPSVTLKNFGTAPLTSATIYYKVDNGTEANKAWTGSLAPNATVSVTLNSITGYSIGGHTFKARTAVPNGAIDATLANDSAIVIFTYTIPLTNDVGISAINTPNGTVTTASVTPSVTLKNFGTATLTSATIYYKVDNGTEANKAWTGSLAPNATVNVALNSVSYSAGNHTFTARTSVPNGAVDAYTPNDTARTSFNYMIPLTNDAGISAIAIPNTITTGSVTPSVTLKNFGTATLTSEIGRAHV